MNQHIQIIQAKWLDLIPRSRLYTFPRGSRFHSPSQRIATREWNWLNDCLLSKKGIVWGIVANILEKSPTLCFFAPQKDWSLKKNQSYHMCQVIQPPWPDFIPERWVGHLTFPKGSRELTISKRSRKRRIARYLIQSFFFGILEVYKPLLLGWWPSPTIGLMTIVFLLVIFHASLYLQHLTVRCFLVSPLRAPTSRAHLGGEPNFGKKWRHATSNEILSKGAYLGGS